MAVGIKRVIVQPSGGMLSFHEAWVFSASVGVCMLSLNTIFLSSYPGRPPEQALRFVLPQYLLAFLASMAGFFGGTMTANEILTYLTALSIFQVLLSLRHLAR